MRMGRRLGALPPKRMIASWSGSHADPTGYKDAARCFAPNWRARLGSFAFRLIHLTSVGLSTAGNRLNL